MRTAVIFSIISIIFIVSPFSPGGALAAGIKFSSAYTDLRQDCRDKFDEVEEGQDMPVICAGQGEYEVHVDFSACCDHMRVEGKNDFELQFPEQKFVTVMKRKLEWRLANGKPFAVIFRIDRYRGDITMMESVKSGEILIIKGLDGFPDIDRVIAVKLYPNANVEARRLADEGYRQQKAKNKK